MILYYKLLCEHIGIKIVNFMNGESEIQLENIVTVKYNNIISRGKNCKKIHWEL